MPGPIILIIDAAASDYDTLAAILHRGGYEVLPWQSPGGDITDLLHRLPDLILLNMQTDFGLRRFRELKSRPQLQQVPILFLLETFEADFAARSLEIGAADFLLKPYQASEVLPRIAVALKVRERELRLEMVQDRYRRLFEDSPQGIFVADESKRLLDCNPALRALLGFEDADDLHGLDLGQDFFYSPADFQLFQSLAAQAGEFSKVKVRLKHRDGHPVAVLMSGQIVQGHPDRIVAYTDLDLNLTEPPAHLPAHITSFSGRPVRKQSLLNLISRLLPFAGNILSVLKLTELLGGRYEKIKRLGQGSYGEVWLVLDTEAVAEDQYYVAKIPFSRGYNTMFRREAVICRKLAPHPGAVQLVDTLEEGGRLILIQEYVRGQTLQDLLEQGEILEPVRERLLLKLIDVVAHAHRLQIMHRDIKPNNIMIGPNDTVKLMDYGAAKELRDRDISATMVGSRPYMAPEQIMGRSQRRSDVWAIGVIMYLLYTGLLPFYDDLEKNLIDLILQKEPVPPRQENPELPEALEAIILKCLQKDVAARYPDAQALKDDLLAHFPDFGSQPITADLLPPARQGQRFMESSHSFGR
ncbi:MAG: protein kinase domain-containing protein [Desulfobacca sp.]|uniref:protein kinase domain-containing protein n=1 Tax=Desulfobacca sp. TaxID=2067990 RepID=UPI00404912A0